MAQDTDRSALFSESVNQLLNDIEEAARASAEGVKRFIEPKQGTLRRASNKRHLLVFGRRGSGKSSLLRKAFANLSLNRQPTAYIDLETFKGHSYPDVLISVMIEAFKEFSKWLDTTAVNSSSNSWWKKLFGDKPARKPINRGEAKALAARFREEISDLERTLLQAEKIDRREMTADESEFSTQANVSGQIGTGSNSLKSSVGGLERSNDRKQIEDTYIYEKEAYLHRNIQRYRQLIVEVTKISESDAFLFLDDLYHIRRADQAKVIDYFHRIAKNNHLWLKIGTIRHRTTWYTHNPSIGVKLGDDADDVDLDISLEQYGLAKDFLVHILQDFFRSDLQLNAVLTEDGKDRLVLASGGVARDFLGIFRRSVDVAKQRILLAGAGVQHRGPRVGAEDVNQAAGSYDVTKQEELQFDLGSEGDERSDLIKEYENIRIFCTQIAKANILSVDKDNPKEKLELIEEIVDLRLLHKIQSNVSISKRQGRKFAAYMLDLSQYTGERKIRDFEMVSFWEKDINLRQVKFVYEPKTDYGDRAQQARAMLTKPPKQEDRVQDWQDSMFNNPGEER